MEQYIPKSALVAEIHKRRSEHFNSGGSPSSEYCHEDDEILGIIDTLEVKEVDLKKEIDNAFLENKCNITDNVSFAEFVRIAKHFFELGIKAAQKG